MFSMTRLLANIRALHFRIPNHHVGLAVRDLLAGYQDNQALRELHHRAHDVLDQDNGDTAFVERPCTAAPSDRTVPVALASVPQTQLTRVVLPDPFGPIRPTRSPAATARSMPSSATKPPKRLLSLLTSSSGIHLLLARRRSCTSPTMPFGAMMTKPTSSNPTMSRLTAEEIVTVAICCREPSRIAPISGPTQLVVPPIIGMAIELTAYSRPNAEDGCR